MRVSPHLASILLWSVSPQSASVARRDLVWFVEPRLVISLSSPLCLTAVVALDVPTLRRRRVASRRRPCCASPLPRCRPASAPSRLAALLFAPWCRLAAASCALPPCSLATRRRLVVAFTQRLVVGGEAATVTRLAPRPRRRPVCASLPTSFRPATALVRRSLSCRLLASASCSFAAASPLVPRCALAIAFPPRRGAPRRTVVQSRSVAPPRRDILMLDRPARQTQSRRRLARGQARIATHLRRRIELGLDFALEVAVAVK